MMERLSRLRQAERMIIETFLRIDDWRSRITAVILMIAFPEDAMQRERGYLPVDKTGSIMNHEVLEQMVATTRETAKRLENDFRIFEVDTSSGDLKNKPEGTAQHVANIILDLIEEHLQEDILIMPREEAKNLFSGRTFIEKNEAEQLLTLFSQKGSFLHRSEAEEDMDSIQALPIVVVRNKSGDVLRLRRRERSETKSLHQKFVIWAGGHVRREDSQDGEPIVHGALRELEEELRLSVEPGDLTLLGAIYDASGQNVAKHAAIVYEWRAKTDDVAVVLSSTEFFERRGTSVSGTFVNLDDLTKEINSGELKEPWSSEIARNLLPTNKADFTPTLFDAQ